MADAPPRRSLNVYLLREGVAIRDALNDPDTLTSSIVDLGDDVQGELFARASKAAWPSWVTFLGVQDALPAAWRPRTLSAVLFVPLENDRIAALPFGQGGRFLLDSEKYEPGFGLRAALNTVPPERVRGISAVTLGGFGVRTERQSGREAPVTAFEHDEFRDLVGGLAGTPSGLADVTSIRGRDSASVLAKVNREGLRDIGQRLVELQSSTTYQSNYGFADNIAPVDQPAADERELELVAQLRSGELRDVGLHPPEVLDTSNVVGFALGITPPDREDFEEASIRGLAALLQEEDSDEAAQKKLRRLRLWAIMADGEDMPRWPARRSLDVERRSGGTAVVLFDGRWWKVAKSLLDLVDDEIAALPRAALPLPDWDKSVHAKEGDYNDAAATQCGWFKLDQENVHLPGRSAIEPCDLLTPQRELVHVKAYYGSGVLSHLFAQGSVSAELLVDAPAFRDGLREKIADATFKDLIPAGSSAFDADVFTVVYAIGAEGGGQVEDVLPFFSRLHLRTHARRIRRAGYPAPKLQRFAMIPKP